MVEQVHICSICLETLDASDDTKQAHCNPCGHQVHAQCLHESIKAGNYVCPVCRQPLSDGVGRSNDESEYNEGSNPDRLIYLVRYKRMLAQKIVPAAVRQRMVADGIDPKIIDEFFTGGASRAVAPSTSDDDDGGVNDSKIMKYKYQKMLDVGIPDGAVRIQMVTAGYSEQTVKNFFDGIQK